MSHTPGERESLARRLLEIEHDLLSRHLSLSTNQRKVTEAEMHRDEHMQRWKILLSRIDEVNTTKKELALALKEKETEIAQINKKLKELNGLGDTFLPASMEIEAANDEISYETQVLEQKIAQLQEDNELLRTYKAKLLRKGPIHHRELQHLALSSNHERLTRLQSDLQSCSKLIDRQNELIGRLQFCKHGLERENKDILTEFRRLATRHY